MVAAGLPKSALQRLAKGFLSDRAKLRALGTPLAYVREDNDASHRALRRPRPTMLQPLYLPLALLAPTPLASLADAGSTGPDLTGYLLVCVGLIGGIAALAYGFRRLFGTALRERSAQRSLAVIDMLPLGGRRKVAVVRCYDRTFALGLGDKEVHLIAELDLEDAPREVLERFPAQSDSFRGELAVARPVPPASQRPDPQPAAHEVPLPGAGVSARSEEQILAQIRREGVLG